MASNRQRGAAAACRSFGPRNSRAAEPRRGYSIGSVASRGRPSERDEGVLRATTTAMPEADNLDQVGEGLRALPNMNEFSPGVLGTNHIRQVLLTVRPHVGDREAMATAIEAYPRIAATTTDRNQRTQRAMNVLIGMSQCGLLQRDGRSILPVFTPVADTLLGCCSDAEADEMFARHILESCQGLELLDAVDMIRDRGEIPTLQAIREELRARGFDITENEGDASKLRQWLEASRIVDRSWEVDEHRLQAVVGAGSSTLAEWQGLTRGQRAFLQVLREQDRTVPANGSARATSNVCANRRTDARSFQRAGCVTKSSHHWPRPAGWRRRGSAAERQGGVETPAMLEPHQNFAIYG